MVNSHSGKRILLGVLDWGLGHASRSVVVARSLLAAGVQLHLTGSGSSLAFLRQELPNCPAHELPPYAIRWSQQNWLWQTFTQAPRAWRQARAEQRWLQNFCTQHTIDGIISDCRFGLYHRRIPSVLLTHQLRLPLLAPWSYPAQYINHLLMDRFTEIWVPDQAEWLAGQLSTPLVRHNIHYLGPLSRFQAIRHHWAKAQPKPRDKPYTLVLLSGPEPQRSILETKIREQIHQLPTRVVLVRGVADGQCEPRYEGPHLVYDYTYGTELAGLLAFAQCVICRSGYSSLMDLAALQKKALLIPTPAQLEQEYLAQYWQIRAWAFAQKQNALDIAAGVAKALDSGGPPPSESHLDKVIQQWLTAM